MIFLLVVINGQRYYVFFGKQNFFLQKKHSTFDADTRLLNDFFTFSIFFMSKEFTTLLKKIIYVLLLPIVLLLIYVILDPFKVIKHYDSYYISDEIPGVSLNKDYVSTRTFENNYSLYKYDSFIFGNSRSMFYEVADWKRYIDVNSSCFHFDANAESLYGMHKKIKYLDSKNVDINNVLFIIDFGTLERIASSSPFGHLAIVSPQLENNKNIGSFHLRYIKAFFKPQFMIAYFDYRLSGKVKEYMVKSFLLDDKPLHYDLKTNEVSYPYFEKLIDMGEYYTAERRAVFYDRNSTEQWYSPPAIMDEQKQMLQEINTVFKKHRTNFKIIVNPLYNQQKLNEHDLSYLNSLFGKERVFDFSGINDFTNDFHNYYEESHYRPHIARKVLEIIYKEE